jgi:hypothetical protein
MSIGASQGKMWVFPKNGIEKQRGLPICRELNAQIVTSISTSFLLVSVG